MRAITGAIVLAVTLTLAGATPSSAQGFDVGQVDVGGVVGLGGINGAGFAVGGRVEKGVKVLPDLGGGILGIEGAFDWYHYNYSLLGVDFGSITVMPFSVTGNYHVVLKNRKLDPFVGLGLGYSRVSWSCGTYNCSGAGNSGLYFVGRAGLRYYWTPKMALYVDAGAGAATLDVGLSVKLGH